jgi:hypothetical protein
MVLFFTGCSEPKKPFMSKNLTQLLKAMDVPNDGTADSIVRQRKKNGSVLPARKGGKSRTL